MSLLDYRDEHSGPLLSGAFLLSGAGNKELVGAGNSDQFLTTTFRGARRGKCTSTTELAVRGKSSRSL